MDAITTDKNTKAEKMEYHQMNARGAEKKKPRSM